MKVKSIILFIIVALIIAMGTSTIYAASASISASNTSVEVGESVNINVSFTAAAWNLTVSGDKISGASFASQTSDLSEVTTTKSFTLDTSNAGTYTVKITGDITDKDGNTREINESTTVTVKEKPATNTETNTETQTNTQTEINTETQTNTQTEINTETQTETQPTAPAEPNFTSVNETVYATSSVNVRASYSTESRILGSLEKGKSVTRTGKGDNGWSRVEFNGNTAYVYSDYLTTTKPEEKTEEEKKEEEKSNNAELKTLSIEGYEISPKFDRTKGNYTLEVGGDVTELKVVAEAQDAKATVDIQGNKELKVGNNKIIVSVNAEDGTKKIYEIDVTKKETVALGLKSLTIEGTDIEKRFKTNVYNYEVKVKDVEKLNIKTETTIEKSTVEILGNEDLKDGENTVTIMVKSEDGKETVTYQVKVNKNVQEEAPVITSNKPKVDTTVYLYGGICALALILLIIIIIFLLKNKSKGQYTFEEELEDDELYNNDKEMKNEFSNDFNNSSDDDDNKGRGKHF